MTADRLVWSDTYGDVRKLEVKREYRSLEFKITTDDDKELEFKFSHRDMRAILEMFEEYKS